jgi:hypothetical protein
MHARVKFGTWIRVARPGRRHTGQSFTHETFGALIAKITCVPVLAGAYSHAANLVAFRSMYARIRIAGGIDPAAPVLVVVAVGAPVTQVSSPLLVALANNAGAVRPTDPVIAAGVFVAGRVKHAPQPVRPVQHIAFSALVARRARISFITLAIRQVRRISALAAHAVCRSAGVRHAGNGVGVKS